MILAIILTLVLATLTGVGQETAEWLEEAANPEAVAEYLSRLEEEPLNFNTATESEIGRLPGFTPSAAQRVIAAREVARNSNLLTDVSALAALTSLQRRSLLRYTTVLSARKTRAHVRLLTTGRESNSAAVHALRLDARVTDASRHRAALLYMRGEGGGQEPRVVSAVIEFVPRRWPLRVLTGDYQLESGTGLVMSSAFGSSNWQADRARVEPGESSRLKSGTTAQRESVWRGTAVEFETGPASAVFAADFGETVSSSEKVLRIVPASDRKDAAARVRTLGAEIGFRNRYARFALCGSQSRIQGDAISAGCSGDDRLRAGSVSGRGQWRGMTAIGEIAKSGRGGHAYQTSVSAGREALNVGVFKSYASADYAAPRGRLWSRFEEIGNNRSSLGIRLASRVQRHLVTAGAESSGSLAGSGGSASGRPAETFDVFDRYEASPALAGVFGISRSWREHDHGMRIRADRFRAELVLGEAERMTLRGELRSVKVDGDNDGKLGSLVFAQSRAVLPFSVESFFRLTFFDLNGEYLRTAIYERSFTGGNPLVPLSGSGRRVAVLLQRKWRGWEIGMKGQLTSAWGASGSLDSREVLLELAHRE